MTKLLTITIAGFLMVASPTFAQITISTNDYLPSYGTVENQYDDTLMDGAFFNSLAAGSGGALTWDFSARTFTPDQYFISVDPSTVPGIDSFTNANLVLMRAEAGDTLWQCFNSVSSSFNILGGVQIFGGNNFLAVLLDNDAEYSFPLNYNDSWTASYSFVEVDGSIIVNYYDTTDYVVDGWGTSIYMSNSVPSLRIKFESRETSHTYDSLGVLLYSDTRYQTGYNFVADGFEILLSIHRQGDIGSYSYYSTAGESFLGFSTDVKNKDETLLPEKIILSQNYPNPFNPNTQISFQIPVRSYVELTIHDLLGRKIITLVNQELSAGEHEYKWNGTDKNGNSVASGIYFYRVKADNFTSSKKMVLLK